MRKYAYWICAALGSAALVELFIFPPPALGWTLFFIACIALYFICYGIKELPKAIDWALIASVVGLALPFVLYNNWALRWFNFIAIAICLIVLFLRRIAPEESGWGTIDFYGEALAGAIVRPFAYLAQPWKPLKKSGTVLPAHPPVSAADNSAHATQYQYCSQTGQPIVPSQPQLQPDQVAYLRPGHSAESPQAVTTEDLEREARNDRRKSIVLQVGLGLLVSIPLLTVLGSFLYSSDPVFASIIDAVVRFIVNLNIGTIVLHASIMAILFPFALSTFWSYTNKKFISLKPKPPEGYAYPPVSKKPKFKFPSVFSATLLLMINILYLVYAAVQFRFLFAGAGGSLPEGLGLIYADYARSGFFELVALAIINFVMISISAYFTHREGRAGLVLKVLTISLVTLSAIQLVSAVTRMSLYIQTFGLSQLRLFVLAYIAFIAIVFVLFIVRELLSKKATPLFRIAALSALALLLGMNYIVPDALIARYNIDRQIAGELTVQRFDFDYYAYTLSFDSVRVLLENEQRLLEAKPELEPNFQRLHSGLARTSEDVPDNRFPTAGPWGYFSSYSQGFFSADELIYADYEESRIPFIDTNRIDNTWRSFNLSTHRLLNMIDR